MNGWSERRGVSDDLCYLRQAHLFKKNGLEGFRTDLRLETDGYFKSLVADVQQPEWASPKQAICHVDMASGKRVLQYPPGVGAFLALFPEGHQVVPLYTAASLVVLLTSFIAIYFATTVTAIIGAGLFGCLAMYFMINPAKASYSIPLTLSLCAVVGFFTSQLISVERHRLRQWTIPTLLGLLLGLSVNLRIPNLLLATGYSFYFLFVFATARNIKSFIQGALFGVTLIVGMSPTLIANTVNAGSPFATTYGGQDVSPADFTFSIARAYLGDLQSVLIVTSILGILWLASARNAKPVATIVTINLIVNVGYFLSHPVFTQYYLIPLAMLTLWSIIFTALLPASARNAGASNQICTSAHLD